MRDHSELMIQREVGESSWFGFSLVIRPGIGLSRARLVERLTRLASSVDLS